MNNSMHIPKQLLLGALFALQLLNRSHAAEPVLNWIRPTNGASFAAGSSILLRANASDPDGTLSFIDYLAGTNRLGRVSGPFTSGTNFFTWSNAPAGIFQLHAEAVDNGGARGVSASVQIVVTNAGPLNNLPVVNLTRPTDGAVFAAGTPIFLTTSATDTDGTVSFVDFFAGSLNLGRANGPTTNGLYNWVWTNASPGMFHVRAEAVDNGGARGVSTSVQIIVSGMTNVPPTNSAVTLNAGEFFTYAFSNLPLFDTGDDNPPEELAYWIAYMELQSTNAHRRVRLEMFEDSAAEAPLDVRIYDSEISNPPFFTFGCYSTNFAWQDRQGIVRLTMLEGSMQLNEMAIHTFIPSGNAYDHYFALIPAQSSNNSTAGCTFALSPTSATRNFGSVTGLVNVTATAGCTWTVLNSNNWITILSGLNGSGSGTVLYALAANTNATSRSGSVTIAGRNFTVSQAGTPFTNGVVALAEALDAAGQPITLSTIGAPAWFGQSQVTHDAVDAAASGAIGDNDATTVQALITGPGTISFWWKASSESANDYLKFFIDGVQQARVSGEVDWQFQTFNLASGTRTSSWTYSKNASGAAGQDRGWVDQIRFTPATNSDCTIALSQSSGAHEAGSATGFVTVATLAGCNWNVATTNPWISIVSGTSGSGNGTVVYAVATNAGAAVRSGNLNIGGQNFTVSQAGTRPALSSTPVLMPLVEITTIGHPLFTPDIPPHPAGPTNAAINFLVDQDQSSGGGGVLPAVSVNWDTNTQFKLKVSAPPNMKFVVTVPAGRRVKFGGFLLWESTKGGFSAPGQVMVEYADLEGSGPLFDQSDSVLSDSHGFFGFIDLDGTGVTNSFSFTSITLTGVVAPHYTGNGTEHYSPHLESCLYLYYSTTETNDPGGFVSLESAGALPMLRVIATSPEAGFDLMVYGRVGKTHIVECSTDTVGWTAISTAVMPPAASMRVRDDSASTKGSRFYRVVELP